MDDSDLALVARLRPEPTPDDDVVTRHRHQLQAAIRAAANGAAGDARTAATDPAATETESPSTDERGPYVDLPARRGAGRGRGWSWRRGTVAAAAAVAVLGGVLAAVGLPSDDERTTTGSQGAQPQPAAPQEAPCGTELPFTFPAPPGFEGPRPGPSEAITQNPDRAITPEAAQDVLQVHWRSAQGAVIDVRWPAYPPMDPTTPWDREATSLSEDHAPWDEGRVRGMRVASTAIGAGQCQEIGIVITSGDPAVVESTANQVQLALAGPGGILPSPATGPLVSESTAADALPGPTSCATTGRPVGDMSTYPTPTDALAAFLVTEPALMQWYYKEIALPDGSFGYVNYGLDVSRAGDPTVDPARPPTTDEVNAVVHIVPRGDGWSAESWQSCSN